MNDEAKPESMDEATCVECSQTLIYSETWGWVHMEPPMPPGHAAKPNEPFDD